ncbi:MAG: ATPase P [Candidatus Roizmanbacteria bacterium]
MISLNIPGYGPLSIKTIIHDLNGTLSVRGEIVPGVKEKIKMLNDAGIRQVLFSGDTRGNALIFAKDLDIEFRLAPSAAEKANLAREYGADSCAAIGNGRIDKELFEVVKLSIIALQSEGVYTASLSAADIVVPTVVDALNLFLDKNILIATLRS